MDDFLGLVMEGVADVVKVSGVAGMGEGSNDTQHFYCVMLIYIHIFGAVYT